jgi:hypothetical protein
MNQGTKGYSLTKNPNIENLMRMSLYLSPGVKFKSKIFFPTPRYAAHQGVDSELCHIAGSHDSVLCRIVQSCDSDLCRIAGIVTMRYEA